MITPMDRGFGDDVFRKMERAKLKRYLGIPVSRKTINIEGVIVAN